MTKDGKKTGKLPLSEEPEVKRLRELIEEGKVKAARLEQYIREQQEREDDDRERSSD